MIKATSAVTLVEIMIAVLIMGAALLPIVDMLTTSSKSTKYERSESEAMQFACDIMDTILMKMDFTDSNIASPTDVTITLKFTDILYKVEVNEVSQASSAYNFVVPRIDYHPPCLNGIEQISTLSAIIVADTSRSIYQLDKEKLSSPSDVDLKDIKLTVRWKPHGADVKDYDRHPIYLYTRKARL
ncbi:MAG: hypothetical protein HQM10_05705 [Candidatus Riflebacteria bacterium]|nr:hypothetical protein [Candidatus Riflebacteria bacterium]